MHYLFVGLGNPGEQYAYTRHNIGFMVVDELAKAKSAKWTKGNGPWDETAITYAGKKALLVKPTTYMNDSGIAVKKLCAIHRISPTNVVVVVDEYNFPTGRIHLRNGGSDGGHNGLTSLIEELQTPGFWRLRCGISRNFGPGELVRYVLGAFPPEESTVLHSMIGDSVNGLLNIMKSGPSLAMMTINKPAGNTKATEQ